MDRIRLSDDFELYCTNLLEACFLYARIFTERIYLRYGVTLPPDACVFDVGANIGMMTLFVHRLCPQARIFAFEPVPDTFAVLRANTELHQVKAHLFQCAVSDRIGTVSIRAYANASVSSGIYPDAAGDRGVLRSVLLHGGMAPSRIDRVLHNADDHRTVDCPARPISDVFAEYEVDTIDLLKVVVQKSEVNVIHGIAESDWTKIRQMIVEVHNVDGRLPRLCDHVRQRGFEVTTTQEPWFGDTDIVTLFATR